MACKPPGVTQGFHLSLSAFFALFSDSPNFAVTSSTNLRERTEFTRFTMISGQGAAALEDREFEYNSLN
jgi:hypothetical protein